MAAVVGGAGGIGGATADLLRADGMRVVALDLPRAAHDARDDEDFMALDATDPQEVERAIGAIVGRHGRLDVLINAAGIVQLGGIEDITPEDWRRIMAVNLDAVFYCCRAAYPHLRQTSGAVVSVSSVSGRTKSILTAPNYVASKAGVIGLTMVLAAQWAADRVRVNCVAPGLTNTGMHAIYTPEQIELMRAAVPIGRFAEPNEVAETVAFLAGDRSAYVTGEVLNVNGGLFMG